jgi:hypothetical protein
LYEPGDVVPTPMFPDDASMYISSCELV